MPVRVLPKTTPKDYSKFSQDIYTLPDHLLPKVNIIINTPVKKWDKINPDDYVFKMDMQIRTTIIDRRTKQVYFKTRPETIKKRIALRKFLLSITPPKRYEAKKSLCLYFVKKKPNHLNFNGHISINVSNYEYYKDIIFEAIENLSI